MPFRSHALRRTPVLPPADPAQTTNRRHPAGTDHQPESQRPLRRHRPRRPLPGQIPLRPRHPQTRPGQQMAAPGPRLRRRHPRPAPAADLRHRSGHRLRTGRPRPPLHRPRPARQRPPGPRDPAQTRLHPQRAAHPGEQQTAHGGQPRRGARQAQYRAQWQEPAEPGASGGCQETETWRRI
ncbi:hypothetical protein D3C81_1003880 [compost metagenome]